MNRTPLTPTMHDDAPALQRPRGRDLQSTGGLVGASVALLAAFSLALFTLLHHHAIRTNTETFAQGLIATAHARFGDVPPLQTDEMNTLRTYLNRDHLTRAERLGLPGITSRADAEALVAANHLVPLADTDYYRVRAMRYSIPYVTEHTVNLLALIGQRFQDALREASLPPYRFVITSGTRTRADQQALGRVNINAALRSSHEYGTTVDLHYRVFDYAAELDTLPAAERTSAAYLQDLMGHAYAEMAATHQPALKAILGRVLQDLQQQDKVLVIYERRQPVYHITVGRPIPKPVPLTPRPPDWIPQQRTRLR